MKGTDKQNIVLYEYDFLCALNTDELDIDQSVGWISSQTGEDIPVSRAKTLKHAHIQGSECFILFRVLRLLANTGLEK